jgi:hypothetical protein
MDIAPTFRTNLLGPSSSGLALCLSLLLTGPPAGSAAEPPPPKATAPIPVGIAPVPTDRGEFPPALKQFIAAKDKQIRRVAEQTAVELPEEVREFLRVATAGSWNDAEGLIEGARAAVRGTSDDPAPNLRTFQAVASGTLLEIQLGFGQIMDSEPALALALGSAIVASIPRGAVYFGGTDSGRGLPTVLSTSHEEGNPFYTLTQNGLADGTYLNYARAIYGKKLAIPTEEDSRKAFQDYISDAERRLKHDREFPNAPKLLKPGEDVRMVRNTVQVSGQVAVMAINARLARMIFDRNPDREFYVEESFPLDWMYPHLAPHGIVLKLNRQPLSEISAPEVAKDLNDWAAFLKPLIGDWLRAETSLDDVCKFVRKVYLDRDLAGFKGDPRYLETEGLQRTYGKLRSAVGGIYNWRMNNPGESRNRERMAAAADTVFKQAFALCPSSPEVVFRYVNLLVSTARIRDALKVAELANELRSEPQMDGLIKELKRMQKQSPDKTPNEPTPPPR